MIRRSMGFVYGAVCYAIFFGVFLYAMGFVGNVFVPKSIDSGPATPLLQALIIDALLLSAFAFQHSIMARQWFKRGWTKVVSPALERSTYVLAATAVLALLMWQWQPVPGVVWDVANSTGRTLLMTLYWLGWGTLLLSTALVDHFELFGLKQVYCYLKGEQHGLLPFKTPALYKAVRHPIYFSFLVAFWSAPRMTFGHLFFSVMCTGYILVAIQFEERDLLRSYGDAYRRYRQQVSMIIPWPRRKADEAAARSAGQK
jgi:protein-S-isoprenylcysteine O-methyltransferase Ste14